MTETVQISLNPFPLLTGPTTKLHFPGFFAMRWSSLLRNVSRNDVCPVQAVTVKNGYASSTFSLLSHLLAECRGSSKELQEHKGGQAILWNELGSLNDYVDQCPPVQPIITLSKQHWTVKWIKKYLVIALNHWDLGAIHNNIYAILFWLI